MHAYYRYSDYESDMEDLPIVNVTNRSYIALSSSNEVSTTTIIMILTQLNIKANNVLPMFNIPDYFFVFLQETQKEDTEHRYEDDIMEKDMLEYALNLSITET